MADKQHHYQVKFVGPEIVAMEHQAILLMIVIAN